MATARAKARQEANARAEDAAGLLARLKIVNADFLIIGDGSGSSWGKGIGWASVLVDLEADEQSVWHGAANYGTVNAAEIMAYLLPLSYLADNLLDRRRTTGTTKAVNVHIVTDSQYLRDTGTMVARGTVPPGGKHIGLWSAFAGFARRGLAVKWHWVPRESHPLNAYCDRLSRASRLHLAELPIPD